MVNVTVVRCFTSSFAPIFAFFPEAGRQCMHFKYGVVEISRRRYRGYSQPLATGVGVPLDTAT